MKHLILLAIFSVAAWGQCPASVTTASGTVCLVGPQGPQGPAGPPGPPGPAAPASNLPITLMPDGSVQIKANVTITGSITTGSGSAAPTVITITRTDGTTCHVTFSPTNSMLWTCP